jgi:DNA polymerase III gamma/tau subunit
MHPWNEAVLESLKNARERLPHALLIHGPRGVG